jgi:hypothetical protein
MSAFKIYRFNTVDEAIQCMMKDTESNKYLHRYLGGPSDGSCSICGGHRAEHMEEEPEEVTMINESAISDTNSEKNVRGKGAEPSYAKVNIAKATLDAFEDPNICRICFDNVITPTNKITLECTHEFCTPCVLGYLKININNGKVSIY